MRFLCGSVDQFAEEWVPLMASKFSDSFSQSSSLVFHGAVSSIKVKTCEEELKSLRAKVPEKGNI